MTCRVLENNRWHDRKYNAGEIQLYELRNLINDLGGNKTTKQMLKNAIIGGFGEHATENCWKLNVGAGEGHQKLYFMGTGDKKW